jgi:hypothetical protein
MNINYKQILTYFSSIAYHNPQIKSFGFGDITQCTNDIVTKQEPQYQRMYVVPGQVTLNQNHIHYNFDVIIMDRVEDDLSNLEEIMSDTMETMELIHADNLEPAQLMIGDLIKIDNDIVEVIFIECDSTGDNYDIQTENEFGETEFTQYSYTDLIPLYVFIDEPDE